MPFLSLPYRTVSTICAALFGALTLALLGAPGVIHVIFGLAPSASADVMSGRAGMLFLGLTLVTALTRTHAPNPTRQALVTALIAMLLGLALIGFVHWIQGAVGFGIWLAILTELALALLLARAR